MRVLNAKKPTWAQLRASHINHNSQKAVFTNEANDFPKRILYEKNTATPEMINIRLEGQGLDGKELTVEYPMFTFDCNTHWRK